MYDRKKKRWCADCENEELLRWCKENPVQPEARFIRASQLLTDLRDGSDVAEAVELMESAAKAEYPKAMFAIGQMFQYGWGVHKDWKTAVDWYQKAVEKGSKEAQKALKEMKRRRIINIVSVVGAIAACIAIAVGIFFGIRAMDGKLTIRVHRDTKLAQTVTLDDFATELQGMIQDNDDELVISGQVSTNRLILKFEGNYLDLSGFLADKVVSREDNLIIIQFSSEEEAQRCLQWLLERDDIKFAQIDKYHAKESAFESDGKDLPIVTSIEPQSGCNSWGVADLGLDQLSAHVAQYYSDREVLVAVVDCGVLPTIEEGDRLVGCFNVMDGNTDVYPADHGTHVAGIILDATRGTNTYVVSVDVQGSVGGTLDSIEALGVDMAVYLGADVINMSMRWVEHSPVLEQAVLDAVAAGVVFCKSAGNDNVDVITGKSCPAELEELLVVGSYNINHEASSFSNYGDTVDICAPGENIYSYAHIEDLDELISYWRDEGYRNPEDMIGDSYVDNTKLVRLDGTSMATPHIAALAALLKTIYPDATPAKIEKMIEGSCRTNRNPAMYATQQYGAGAPDATVFIEQYLY